MKHLSICLLCTSFIGICCGFLGASESPAIQALKREREISIEQLQSVRKKVETERQSLLTRIQKAQAELVTLQNETKKTRLQLQSLEQQIQEEQSGLKIPHNELQQLIRRLISEGAEVDYTSTPKQLLNDWSNISSTLLQHFTQLKRDCEIRQSNEAVLNRLGNEETIQILHWGAVQRIALGNNENNRGFLKRLQDGSWQIAGTALPLAQQNNSENLLFDPSNSLALRTVKEKGPLSFIQEAGPFAWPILTVAIVGLIIILDRISLLWRWRVPKDIVDRLIANLDNPEEAQKQTLQKHAAPTTQILRTVLDHQHSDQETQEQQAGAALVEADIRLQRGLRLLGVLAATAPLLGLLGTVTGMISSFQALDMGNGGNAAQLSAGISEALLTTELGLIVAIPLLLAHALFSRDAQRRRAQGESAAMRLIAAQPNTIQNSVTGQANA